MQSSRYSLILFFILIFTSAIYGFFIEETIWFFLGSSNYYLNDGILFGRGFLIILAPSFLIFAPLFGHFADKFGDKRVILSCLILLIISCVLLFPALQHASIEQIILAHFLFGFGMCILPIIYAALFRISANSQIRLKYVILAAIFSHVSFITGIIAHHYGLFGFTNLTINTIAISVSILSIILALGLKPPASHILKQRNNHTFSRRVTRLMISKKFKNIFLIAGCIAFAHGLFIESPHQHAHLLTTEHKHDYDLFMAISYTVMCLGALTLLFLNKYFKQMKIILATGAVLVFIGCFGELFAITHLYFWGLSIVSSFGFGLLSLILFYGSFSSGTSYLGITMGLYLSLWALCMALANIMISFLSIYFNHTEILNISRILICLLMLFLGYSCYKQIKLSKHINQ